MRITLYLFKCLAYIIGVLPFCFVYSLSDILYYLLYYVFRYRRAVVERNIHNSFPTLAGREKKRIVKKFYRNLSDIILEGLKSFKMGKHTFGKRFHFINPDLLNDYFDRGQSVIAVGAHYANWEWGIIAAPILLRHKLIAFYTPLSNPYFDSYLTSNRSKFGTLLIPTNEFRKALKMEAGQPVVWFFGADQSPSNLKGVQWVEFLHQDTACVTGPEFFARHYGFPVVYFDVQRIKRGYYAVELKLLETKSRESEKGEITKKYMSKLESIIINKPEDYLWSHRRWKHQR